MSEECSGAVLINGEKKCKHGFPYMPQCRRDPMKIGVYSGAPCVDERLTERFYPDTGTPPITNPYPTSINYNKK
jgi:hypothetical protein